MAGLPSPPLKGISLLFVKADDLASPSNQREFLNGLEIIYAIEKVTGRGTIEGAQKIGKLYRIYIKNENARDKLYTEGFVFRDRQVSLYSNNPFTVKEQIDTVKIIIGGVPLSVAHEEFEKALIELNVEIISDIKFENYRDSNGKWTSYKTGRRFVYCKKPHLNLKPFTKVGIWNASVYYMGQVRPTKNVPSKNNQSSENNNVTQMCSEDHMANTIDTVASDASGVPSGSTAEINKSDLILNTNSVWDIPGKDSSVDTVASEQSQHAASAGLDRQSNLLEGKGNVLTSRGENSSATQETTTAAVTSHSKQLEARSRKPTRVSQHRLPEYMKDRRQRSQSTSRSKRKGLVSLRTPSPPPKTTKIPLNVTTSSPLPIDWFNRVESR